MLMFLGKHFKPWITTSRAKNFTLYSFHQHFLLRRSPAHALSTFLRRSANVTEAHTDSSNYSKRNQQPHHDLWHSAKGINGSRRRAFVCPHFIRYLLPRPKPAPPGRYKRQQALSWRAPTCTRERNWISIIYLPRAARARTIPRSDRHPLKCVSPKKL